MNKVIRGWFDGSCWPNPGGRASYGWAASCDGYFHKEGSGIIGEGLGMSNNVAEYMGVFSLLEWLKSQGYENENLVIYGDSKLVVEQLNGRWRVKGGMYVEAFKKSYCMIKEFKQIRVKWIPREQNGLADSLSKGVLGIKPDEARELDQRFKQTARINR